MIRKLLKTKNLLVCIVCGLLLIIVISLCPTIFQRGNPFPYLIAVTKISSLTPYCQVKSNGETDVFISFSNVCPELIAYIEHNRNVKFEEQGGSIYLFKTDTNKQLLVKTEVFWRKYIVWEVPKEYN